MGKKKTTQASGSDAQSDPDENIEDDFEEPTADESSSGDTGTEFDSLVETEDFKDFVRIAVATGKTTEAEINDADDLARAKIVDMYTAWVKTGRLRPQMPQAVTKNVEQIEKIYRIKSKGIQYLYYVKKGSGEPVGIKKTPIHPTNGGVEDTSITTGWIKEYTIPYSDRLAHDLLEKAKRYTENPGLYLVQNTLKIAVQNQKNFFADFDEMFELAVQRKAI